MMVPLLLLSLARADTTCPDLDDALKRADDALIAARLDEARAALTEVEAAFSCGDPPTAEQLASHWLTEAAVASVEGRDGDARDAWQAAARLAPELWEPRHGPDLKARRDEAVAAAVGGAGTIRVDPLPDRHTLVLDGVVVSNPAEAAEGLHLVQVARREAVYGKVVLLGPDENMLIKPVIAPREEAGPRVGKAVWFAGGAAGLAAGAGLLVVAANQSAPMDETLAAWQLGRQGGVEARATVNQHWTIQRVTGGAGYALLGLGAASVGVGFVW